MASPQIEDGYTRIANELFDVIIQHPFSKRELKIVFAIIRKTYGYHKKTDVISLSQLAKITGITRTHVCKTLSDLEEKKVLLKQAHLNSQVIGINKNYKSWVVLPKQALCPKQARSVPKTGIGCAQNSNAGVPKTGNTKETSTKEIITKENIKKGGDALTPLLNLNIDAWNEYEQYRRQAKIRKLQPQSVAKQQKWLSEQGSFSHQQAIVDKAIRNGHQGLFALKGGQQGVQETRHSFAKALEN